jgi:biotin carboxylase
VDYAQPVRDPIFRHYPGQFILEERIEGSEHSVEGILMDGVLLVAIITDKEVMPPFFMTAMELQPTTLAPKMQLRIRYAADAAVRAIGLRDGAFHLELKVTEDGRPLLLEINARTGGSFITSHLVRYSYGFDFLTATLRVLCGLGKPEPLGRPFAGAGSAYVIANKSGQFRGLEGLEDALCIPGIQHFTYELPIGAAVRQPPEAFTTAAVASFISRGAGTAGARSALEDALAVVNPVVA